MKIQKICAGLSLSLMLSLPGIAQDKEPEAFNFGKMMQSIMISAQQDKYADALVIAKSGLPNVEGLQRLQVLHLLIDLHRINEKWAAIPAMVDEFITLHGTTKIPEGRKTWASSIMSEKVAASVAIGNLSAARDASQKALSLYGDLSSSWTVNEAGDWVSKKTQQACPMIWQGHIRFDAYDREDGSTGCRFWDSNFFNGVSLTLYKTDVDNSEQALSDWLSNYSEEKTSAKQGDVVEADLNANILKTLPSNSGFKSYRWNWDRNPTNGVIIVNEQKNWMLDVSYNDASIEHAERSLSKIKASLSQ